MLIQFLLKVLFPNLMENVMKGIPVPRWFKFLFDILIPFMVLEAIFESFYYAFKNIYNIAFSIIDMKINSYKMNCKLKYQILLLSYFVPLALCEQKLNNNLYKDSYVTTKEKLLYNIENTIFKHNIDDEDKNTIISYYENRLK